MFYINFIFPLICISQIRGKIFLVISFHQILDGAGEGRAREASVDADALLMS